MFNTNNLQVNSLNKSFKNIRAVKDISFSLDRGDIFAFLGSNVAGKTTTLRILLDIIKADSGSITWNINENETAFPPSGNIGQLSEEQGLYTDLPIIRSLVYLASIRGMDPKKAKTAAMEWLVKLDLAERAKEKLQTLSKGNQQKIQFVASILHKPSFVILDEPFSGLDPQNQEKFIKFIREMNEQGTTLLLSSHQMSLVEKIARKVFLINNGKEIFSGTLADLYKTFGQQHILDISFSSEESLSKMKLLKNIEIIAASGENTISVTFLAGIDFKQILSELSAIEGITNIKSTNSSLHDIFLKIVKEHQS